MPRPYRGPLLIVLLGASIAAAVLGTAASILLHRSATNAGAPTVHRLDPSLLTSATAELPSVPSGFAFQNEPRPLPELRFIDRAGESHSIAEFRDRPLVLNIWATWCVPCRKEMPTLDHLQAILAGTDALVVPLSIDSKGPSAVEAFYKEIGIRSLGIYVDQTDTVSQLSGMVGIPTTRLVDRDGGGIGRKIGPLAWDAPEIVALIRGRLDPRSRIVAPRASP